MVPQVEMRCDRSWLTNMSRSPLRKPIAATLGGMRGSKAMVLVIVLLVIATISFSLRVASNLLTDVSL